MTSTECIPIAAITASETFITSGEREESGSSSTTAETTTPGANDGSTSSKTPETGGEASMSMSTSAPDGSTSKQRQVLVTQGTLPRPSSKLVRSFPSANACMRLSNAAALLFGWSVRNHGRCLPRREARRAAGVGRYVTPEEGERSKNLSCRNDYQTCSAVCDHLFGVRCICVLPSTTAAH